MGDSTKINFEYDSADKDIKNVAGERRHIKFGSSPTNETDSVNKYNGILTCLKEEGNLHSFSILINDNNNEDIFPFIKSLNIDITIYKKNTNVIYNFINDDIDILKKNFMINDNYMLIIGNLNIETSKILNVVKIILISNNDFGSDIVMSSIYDELLTHEEYLNLYYIEHFSLNIQKFIEDKYKSYRDEISTKAPAEAPTPAPAEEAPAGAEATTPAPAPAEEAPTEEARQKATTEAEALALLEGGKEIAAKTEKNSFGGKKKTVKKIKKNKK